MHNIDKNIREEYKSYLRSKGIDGNFLEMPAVMERIYSVLRTNELEKIPLAITENGKKVELNGTYVFKLNEDGSAKMTYIKNNDNELDSDSVDVKINKYGIDESYIDSTPEPLLLDWFSEVKRVNDGTVLKVVTGGSSINSERISKEDDGNPFLYFDEPDGKEKKEDFQDWESNREFITTEYPKTKAWYEEKEEQKVLRRLNPIERKAYLEEKMKTVPKEKIIKYYEEILAKEEVAITQMQNTIKSLKEQESELKEKISKTQMMLLKSLKLATKIKESAAGKIFFPRSVGKLNKALKDAGDLIPNNGSKDSKDGKDSKSKTNKSKGKDEEVEK